MFAINLRRWLWIAAWVAAFGLSAANLWLGDLNQDEGWYLYAARQVSEGRMLYRDFAFPQGPVQPLLYAGIYPLVELAGTAGGRAFSVMLGVLAALLAARTAGMLVEQGNRKAAALLAFVLISVNVYQSYYFAVVKTYAAAAFFLAGSVYLLALAVQRTSAMAAFAAGVFAVLASGTRASMGVLLPVTAIYLVLEWRSTGFRGLVFYAAGALAAGAVVLLPFAFYAWENFYFFVFQYHTLRQSGSLLSTLVYKAGFVSRLIQAYLAAVVLWIAVCLARCSGSFPAQPGSHARRLRIALWIIAACMTSVHFFAPFPYDDYQVPVYPLFAVAVAVAAVRLVGAIKPAAISWLLAVVFAACLLTAGASPLNQDWFLLERDRIWWRLKDQTPLAKLRDTAASLREITKPGDLLFTQDPYLAVESGLRLPHGLELGQFSYFPGFDKERAQRLNVLNRELFLELIASCNAPAAALSGYAFAIESPDINPVPESDATLFREALRKRYELVGRVSHFGQAFTELEIYRLKERKILP